LGCNKEDALIFYKTENPNPTDDEEKLFIKMFCFGCKNNNQCEKVA